MFEQFTAVAASEGPELFAFEKSSGKPYIWNYDTGKWVLYQHPGIG